jgi:hypothetical protein
MCQILRITAGGDTERDMTDERTKQLFHDRVELEAVQLNEKAETFPHGHVREALLHKARQMITASAIIDRWLLSPGLRAPR